MSDDDARDPAQAEQASEGGPLHVELEHDAVSEIIAETVVVRQGAVQRIDANDVEVKQAGVLFARAETLDITQAGVMGALGGEVNLELSAARFVGARGSVRLEQSAALVAISDHVEVAPNSAVGVLIARTVNGDVRPLFDWRAAAAFGAVAGLVCAAARALFPRRG
jgi:hypothetical protein